MLMNAEHGLAVCRVREDNTAVPSLWSYRCEEHYAWTRGFIRDSWPPLCSDYCKELQLSSSQFWKKSTPQEICESKTIMVSIQKYHRVRAEFDTIEQLSRSEVCQYLDEKENRKEAYRLQWNQQNPERLQAGFHEWMLLRVTVKGLGLYRRGSKLWKKDQKLRRDRKEAYRLQWNKEMPGNRKDKFERSMFGVVNQPEHESYKRDTYWWKEDAAIRKEHPYSAWMHLPNP